MSDLKTFIGEKFALLLAFSETFLLVPLDGRLDSLDLDGTRSFLRLARSRSSVTRKISCDALDLLD